MDEAQWDVNKDDLLKKQIRFRISAWYDHWFMGEESTKEEHLRLFEEYYDPSLFDNSGTKEEREKSIRVFLEKLQDKFNEEMGFFGG